MNLLSAPADFIPTNSTSCMFDASAVALEVSQGGLRELIGQDDNHWEHGYHVQEIADAAAKLGKYLCPFERFPSRLNPLTKEVTKVTIGSGSDQDYDCRFALKLVNSVGIVEGVNSRGIPHAIAWLGVNGFDPATGQTVELLDHDTFMISKKGLRDDCTFTPICFWKVVPCQK